MSETIAKGLRGKQIVRLLSEHGPMSVRGLSAVLEPQIHPRRLRTALKRLGDCGILEKQFDGMFRGAGVFYCMAKDIHPEGHSRRAEYLHSETCAVWTERLRKLFPNAAILRDHQFMQNDLVKRALVLDQNDPENRPDMIIITRPERGDRPVIVAIEIERHHKSQERIVQKLRRFARGSRLDGVIYLCPKGTIGRRIRTIYESHIVERSHLIKYYGKNFLLLGESMSGDYRDKFPIQNVAGENILLENWMQILQRISREDRRDSDFRMGAFKGHEDRASQ